MKKIILVTLSLIIVGCATPKVKTQKKSVKKQAKTVKDATYVSPKATGWYTNQPLTEAKSTEVKSIEANSIEANSIETKSKAQKVTYTCSDLNELNAYKLLRQGHKYLDRDGDGHPCEWGKTSIKKSSSRCSWVRGYTRKNGTRVKGHQRCRH